ncbi:MAG TPA: proton-conducting transporter membrane subunit, partial [Solirubrobacteraceae bacterium]
ATVFYLAVYLFMNMAAFAVIVARERETALGDSIQGITGLGRERPWLAAPMTVSMLALAGIPATAGFTGKFYLIDAAVSGGYTWLGVVIVIGSMISLGYYLPVIAAIWMRPAPLPDAAIRRFCSWRCWPARRRSSSASFRSRCSTSCTTRAAPWAGCSSR